MPQHPEVRSRQCSQSQKPLQISPRFPRRPPLFVGAADGAEVTEIALPLVRRGWKKGTGHGVANRLSNLSGCSASTFIERNNALGEAADRRTEIEAPSRNLGLSGEQLFRGESVKQGLERLAAVDELAPPGVRLSRLMIGDPR